MMRNRVRRQCYYDARVNDVNLRDITSSEKNANHLRALRDEQPDNFCKKLSLMTLDYYDSREYDFVIREGDDLGWLGYFIRRSKRIEQLSIHGLPEGRQLDALIEGIAHNQSIHEFHFVTEHGYQSFERDCILRSGKILYELEFSNMNIGSERAHNVASILGQVQPNSMKTFLFHNNTCDESFAVICGELRSHPQLERLYLYNNDNFGRNGYVSLGNMLSSWHVPNLKELDLSDNSIDDRGLQALVEGMTNCSNLSLLILSGNRSITAAGFRSLSTFFQSDNCSLEELWLEEMRIGDDEAVALAEVLVSNNSLKYLLFDCSTAGITSIGWKAFLKLLCDTSSTNNTYLSNHTLEWIGANDHSGTPADVKKYLDCNIVSGARNKHDVAILKTLRHFKGNLEFIESLFQFQWKLKFLPLVVAWFDRARSVITILDEASNEEISRLSACLERIETMKLSAVHKFVCGMPLVIIDGYNSRRTSKRLSRKRRLDGETK